jgi:hypothetical protein
MTEYRVRLEARDTNNCLVAFYNIDHVVACHTEGQVKFSATIEQIAIDNAYTSKRTLPARGSLTLYLVHKSLGVCLCSTMPLCLCDALVLRSNGPTGSIGPIGPIEEPTRTHSPRKRRLQRLYCGLPERAILVHSEGGSSIESGNPEARTYQRELSRLAINGNGNGNGNVSLTCMALLVAATLVCPETHHHACSSNSVFIERATSLVDAMQEYEDARPLSPYYPVSLVLTVDSGFLDYSLSIVERLCRAL